jgi:hypothetical protein
MERSPLAVFELTGQFDASSPLSRSNPTRLAPGSENIVWRGGRLEAFNGLGDSLSPLVGARYLTNVSDSYGGLGSFANSTVKGSVLKILNGLFAIGNGAVYYAGSSLSFNATSTLQIKLLVSGAWSMTTYQAGLPQASPPTLAIRDSIGAGFTGRNKAGSYSAKAFLIRDATGAKGLASEMSNIVVIEDATATGNGKTLRITFPPIGSSGADYWGLAVTARNFGSTGSHFVNFKIAESALTTIDGVPRSYEIEWTDGDLAGKDLAPIASYPPPAGMFCGVLGDCLFVDGCVGDTVTGVSAGSPGSTIAISLPLFVEEFPPDWRLYPPEAPTALIRGGDDYYYRFGKNSMGVVSYVGGSPPLYFQQLWSNVGISYPHNAVVGAGGMLFAKTGKRGLVRLGAGAQPDSTWSDNVASIIKDWSDAETVLGWDEDSQTVCAMNNETILPFHMNNGWGAPLDVSDKTNGRIVSAVTHEGQMYVAALNTAGSSIDLFKYDDGTGSLMTVRTDWHYAEAESEYLRIIDVVSRLDNLDNDITVDLFINEDDTTPFRTWTITPTRSTRIRPLKMGKKVESFSVKISHLSDGGSGMVAEKIIVSGYPVSITR